MPLAVEILAKKKRPRFGLILLLLLVNIIAWGQKAANPFEIIPKLDEEIVEKLESKDSKNVILSNPFEVVKSTSTDLNSEIRTEIKEELTAPVKETAPEDQSLIQAEKTENYKQFLFITVFVMMIILTLLFTFFRIIVVKSYRAFLNDNILNQLQREQGAIVSFPYLTLYLMFFFIAGLFLFLILNYYHPITDNYLTALLYCIGGILGVFILKHILLKIIGFIFPLEKELGVYSFTIIIFNIIISLGLVPFIISIAFAPPSFTPYLIYTSFGLILAVLLFRNLRGLFIGNRFIAFHKFHFLLYICAVEIAPLLIIFKILLSRGLVQNGMG